MFSSIFRSLKSTFLGTAMRAKQRVDDDIHQHIAGDSSKLSISNQTKHSSPKITTPLRVIQSDRLLEIVELSTIQLSTAFPDQSEFILDYGRAEGGFPIFHVAEVVSDLPTIEFDVVYSETRDGIDHEAGDGPYFFFSNSMNTYRRETYNVNTKTLQHNSPLFGQLSQRYQKIVLRTPNSTLRFKQIGFDSSLAKEDPSCFFKCSDEVLNRVYSTGVRTVQLCTVSAGETREAWEVTQQGTRITGQHWAPCRFGTRWIDYNARFEMKIEKEGASWGVKMVTNGLIFVLDKAARKVEGFVGLANIGTVFPTAPQGSWEIPESISLEDWVTVESICEGPKVAFKINGHEIGKIEGLDLHPLLGGANNSGSVAFGGPANYVTIYRNLQVTSLSGDSLYENSLLLSTKDRTLADFAVGTNHLPCTVDGAKRDRACFAGDLYVMGRSIIYSTGNMDAFRGSIRLLTSHQTKDGYLGNLCPIQAPVHDGPEETPTYAFYSMSYALLLITAIKDYYLHTGDLELVRDVFPRLEKFMGFAEKFVTENGLLIAPPPLSMDWFPLGGPIFGASAKINLAYYESLTSISILCTALHTPDAYSSKASALKSAILTHLWSSSANILRMSDSSPANGICQDVNGYSGYLGISPTGPESWSMTSDIHSESLPRAYRNIPAWDRVPITSPYACGFEAEALFSLHKSEDAMNLVRSVWGPMTHPENKNYSGAHWEAMKTDGTPFGHDTSLAHGWSTWPVFLLPRYVAGMRAVEAGWRTWACEPDLGTLSSVSVGMETPMGQVKVVVELEGAEGKMKVFVPKGSTCRVKAPVGWEMLGEGEVFGKDKEVVFDLRKGAS